MKSRTVLIQWIGHSDLRAMAAVWVLLGKTRYPAKFLETFAGIRGARTFRLISRLTSFRNSCETPTATCNIWRRKARRTSRGLRISPVRVA